MVGENQDVKDKVTDTGKDSSTDKDQVKDKGKDTQSQTVPYERFKEVNDERNAYRQKAEALDALWQDPDFQEWVEAKEKGGTPKGKDDIEEDLDKPLTRAEAKSLFKEVFQEEMKPHLAAEDKEKLDKALREVVDMEKDKTFPYFLPWSNSKEGKAAGATEETDAIRKEMIRLMEQGEVVSLPQAYKVATYDLALQTKETEHQKEVTEVKKFGRVRGRSTVALSQTGPKLYKSVREAAEETADKLDI